MKISKYYPFAFIYFFVNAVALPFGLLYTILLTPLFYVWIVLQGRKQILLKFLLFSTPFIISHFLNGVDRYYYIRSLLVYFTVYIFCYAFYTLITRHNNLEEIFRKLLRTNFALTIIALAFLLSPYRQLFWMRGHWGENWQRLTMFTYEPSYYSILLVPIFGFYFVKYILGQIERRAVMTMLMITLPLILALSLGVIGGLVLSAIILFFINFSKFLTRKRLFYSFCVVAVAGLVAFIGLLIFYRDNPLFVRAMNFMAGTDQSGSGRTSEAFQLAFIIAKVKSIWWGIGPGQLKVFGDSIIRDFYKYPPTYGQVSIPNAFAETFALFGIVGVALRLFVIVYLFFKTRVLNNYYQTFLFFFIVVYQFTGSFTTSIAEYVIWILAFTHVFPQFDKNGPKRLGKDH